MKYLKTLKTEEENSHNEQETTFIVWMAGSNIICGAIFAVTNCSHYMEYAPF